MDRQLRILVTGAGRGIGKAIVSQLKNDPLKHKIAVTARINLNGAVVFIASVFSQIASVVSSIFCTSASPALRIITSIPPQAATTLEIISFGIFTEVASAAITRVSPSAPITTSFNSDSVRARWLDATTIGEKK